MADYIIQLEGCFFGNSIRINEIELFDRGNNKLTYSVANAYDSVAKNVPYYWNHATVFNKNGLNDGNKTYSSSTSTVLLYNISNPSATPLDSDFVRILVSCNSKPFKATLNFVGLDPLLGGVAKFVSVFEGEFYPQKILVQI